MRPRRWLLLVVIGALVLGCDSSPKPSGPSGAPSTTAAASASAVPAGTGSITPAASDGTGPAATDADAVAAAKSTIEDADLGDDSTLDAVELLRSTKAGVEAARQTLEATDDIGPLWAALWVYDSGSRDPAPLRRLTDHPDPTIATMAGAMLVDDGEATGFPALARALALDGWLAGAHPPRRTSEFAASTLLGAIVPSTSAPFPDPDAPATTYAAAWSAWLDAHATALVYDPTSARWSLP